MSKCVGFVPATPKPVSSMVGPQEMEQIKEETAGSINDVNDQEKIPVTLPTKIVKDALCYVTETAEIFLPLNTPVDVKILYVDNENVFHVKLAGNNTLQKESFGNTLFNMNEFYTYPENRRKTRFGLHGWKPVVNEVVVVNICRKVPVKNSYRGFVPKREYQRAQVLQLYQNGAKIQLLDDYGIGGITDDSIFKIMPSVALSKAQAFAVELCDLEILNGFDGLQRVMQKHPIPGVLGDLTEYTFSMTFSGNYGNMGRPRVQLKFFSENSEVDLRDHVLQQLHKALSPIPYLDCMGSSCVVARFDSYGYFYIRLVQHEKLFQDISKRLLKIKEIFKNLLLICPLFLDNILTKEHVAENLNAVYLAMIPTDDNDTEVFKSAKLRRVKIKSYTPGSNLLCVWCIDYGTDHYVNTYDILPAVGFHDVLSFIPPLVHKVHLNKIKKLQTDNEIVQNLFKGVTEVCLVQQYNPNGQPPEVRFYFLNEDSDEDSQLESLSLLKSDIGSFLLQQKYAVAASKETDCNVGGSQTEIQNPSEAQVVIELSPKPSGYCSFSNFQFAWQWQED